MRITFVNCLVVVNAAAGDDDIHELTAAVTHLEEIMAQEFDTLTTTVGETETVVQSAVVLLDGIKAALDEAIASNDPAAIQALSDRLGVSKQGLAEAIIRNTPAAP